MSPPCHLLARNHDDSDSENSAYVSLSAIKQEAVSDGEICGGGATSNRRGAAATKPARSAKGKQKQVRLLVIVQSPFATANTVPHPFHAVCFRSVVSFLEKLLLSTWYSFGAPVVAFSPYVYSSLFTSQLNLWEVLPCCETMVLFHPRT